MCYILENITNLKDTFVVGMEVDQEKDQFSTKEFTFTVKLSMFS